MEFLNNIHNNMGPYINILGYLYLAFSGISLLTPSKKDDKIKSKLDKIGHWADRLGFQFKKKI